MSVFTMSVNVPDSVRILWPEPVTMPSVRLLRPASG